MPSFSVRPTSIPTREVDRAEEAAVRAEVAAEKVGQTIDLATQLIKDVADAREEMIPITSQIESIPGVINAAVNTINNTRTEAVQSINANAEMAQEGISMQTTGALSAISSQETSSRSAVMTAGMNEIGSIAQAKNSALTAIDTAKDEAVDAIDTAKDEAIEAIEEAIEGAGSGGAGGEAGDSEAATTALAKINENEADGFLKSKNISPIRRTSSITVNSVTTTFDSETGVTTMNGNNRSYAIGLAPVGLGELEVATLSSQVLLVQLKANKTYTLSIGDVTGSVPSNTTALMQLKKENGSTLIGSVSKNNNTYTYTPTADEKVQVRILVGAGTYDCSFKHLFCEGTATVDDGYIPWNMSNRELTKELSTSHETNSDNTITIHKKGNLRIVDFVGYSVSYSGVSEGYKTVYTLPEDSLPIKGFIGCALGGHLGTIGIYVETTGNVKMISNTEESEIYGQITFLVS